MGNYIKVLTEKVLNTSDYIQVLREATYNVKTFEEFVKQLQDFDARVKKKGIKTNLIIDTDDGKHYVRWEVDQEDRVLCVVEFNNGKVQCKKSERFRAPGRYNVNDLTDANQILKLLDSYVFSLERDDVIAQKQASTSMQSVAGDSKDKRKVLSPEEKEAKEDREFVMDPEVRKILEDLKVKGDNIVKKVMSVPPYKTQDGTVYKIKNSNLLSSTERELVAVFEFGRVEEMKIYSDDKDGEVIRTGLLKYYKKNTKLQMGFRLTMENEPYFYTVVGKLPVKKASGPEARVMLNYYDGAVQFQPKEDSNGLGWPFEKR